MAMKDPCNVSEALVPSVVPGGVVCGLCSFISMLDNRRGHDTVILSYTDARGK